MHRIIIYKFYVFSFLFQVAFEKYRCLPKQIVTGLPDLSLKRMNYIQDSLKKPYSFNLQLSYSLPFISQNIFAIFSWTENRNRNPYVYAYQSVVH